MSDPRQRTGFAPFDAFLDALYHARELPGVYPEELTAKARKRALRKVNSGYLREAAILTREAITEWGDCYGVLSTITENLLGTPPERQRWQGPTDVVNVLRGDAQHPGLADVIAPETEKAAIMKIGLTFGVGLGRLARTEIRGRTMRRLSAWDTEHARYDWPTDTWHVQTSRGTEWRARSEDKISDGEWILFLPYGEKFPWTRAPWKAITLAYTLARDGWFQRSRYAQRVAPINVGTSNESSTAPQRQKFLELLDGAQFDTSIILRPGETLEKKGVSGGDPMVAIFEQIDSWARRTMITCLKGETVTTDGTPGFSSGSSQDSMSAAKKAFNARALSRFESAIFSWAAFDLTGEHAEVTRIYDTTTPADSLAQINALSKAGDMLGKVTSGAKGVDLQPVRGDIARLFEGLGLRLEEIPDTANAIPDQAFNGAQVTAAAAIIGSVASGQTPRDAGIGELIALFNLTAEQAESMMGSAGAGFTPTEEP